MIKNKQEWYYDVPFTYGLHVSNRGLIALGGMMMADRLPDGLELQGPVSISPSGDGLHTKVFYSTDSSATVPSYATGDVFGAGL